jgi:acyl-CoA synthetase (AMP-forming)/AMP-acid ligase II
MTPGNSPLLTLADFEQRFRDSHLLHGVVDKWAREKPASPALVDADRNRVVTWAEFESMTRALALVLLKRGLGKGDLFASLLPLTSEHIFLEYACFRIGAIFVPLDLRLSASELMRSLSMAPPAAIAFVKASGIPDPASFCTEVRMRFSMKLVVQFATSGECPG